jgi:hypothetical protein
MAMPRQDSGRTLDKKFIDQLEALSAAAINFVAPNRRDVLMRKFLPRRDRELEGLSEDQMLCMAADAFLLSSDLLLSQPSANGSTAFDRLAKSRAYAAGEAAAIAALCRGRFRLLRMDGDGGRCRDVCTDERLNIAGDKIPPLPAGTMLFGRVVMLGGGEKISLPGAVTPLDATAVLVASQHPAAGAIGAASGARWAEAVYAHVVRNGTLNIPGLNRPRDFGEDDEIAPGQDPLYDLSRAWAALDGVPDAALLQSTRQSADLPTIMEALAAAVMARDTGRDALADAFEQMLFVQLETVQHREASWAGALTLDIIAQALDDAVAARAWPARVKTLFETLRKRLTVGRAAKDPALERLVQRIQALRAKTVSQGCTEQEALAAAEKVAELLDRHGLSLNELAFRAQPCEGIGIQTSRRRIAPIDSCIPAIAAFFDCRVWAERAEGAPLRYIFFGLRGDVAAARYLYEMVEHAFETETDAFRTGDLYFEMAGERRSATNSFQTGLARGIAGKLQTLRAARDTGLRSASGRDLVPVKAAMVAEEMEKLGLNLSRRDVGGARRVLSDAYAAGEAAGQRFEYAQAVTHAA